MKAICRGGFALTRTAACVLLLTACFAASAWAAKPDLSCRYGLKDAPADAPKFSDFPARAEYIPDPSSMALQGKRAQQYRTILRDAARRGPNFAGRYAIADIGCGPFCSYWAMIDEVTGDVSFYPEIESVSGAQADDYRLQHRVDSNLLILLGGPHKDESRGGIFYYQWDGKGFHLLRFVPADTICKRGG